MDLVLIWRRPCGVVGRATFLTSRTDYRWRFDSPLGLGPKKISFIQGQTLISAKAPHGGCP